MSTNYIAKDVKEEIIRTIKTEGITAAEAGRRYGINVSEVLPAVRYFGYKLDFYGASFAPLLMSIRLLHPLLLTRLLVSEHSV